jgi:hypothetical protein
MDDFFWRRLLDVFHSYASADALLNCLTSGYPDTDPRHAYFEQRKKELNGYVATLSPATIGSLRTISHEYMVWLRRHPRVVSRVAWEAFEGIVAEIFASKGYTIDLRGRVRNATCDVLALRTDEFGVDTRYLIECKKYSTFRRVGLSVVDQVIGSSAKNDVDHAFLVTTSSFTRDVLSQKARFQDLRLHLRDGEDIIKWLQAYTPRQDGGLWLDKDWTEVI